MKCLYIYIYMLVIKSQSDQCEQWLKYGCNEIRCNTSTVRYCVSELQESNKMDPTHCFVSIMQSEDKYTTSTYIEVYKKKRTEEINTHENTLKKSMRQRKISIDYLN